MLSRKEIRGWFYRALSHQPQVLGKVYPARVVEFDPDEEMPKVFSNIYISDGEHQASDGELKTLTYMTVEIGFNMKNGKDDDLDHMEFIADEAIEEYIKMERPGFSFFKVRFSYGGDAEDAYEQLYITFQLITR